jgi:hemerythrin
MMGFNHRRTGCNVKEINMAILWTDDLATGVTKIDDQHKELFSRINRLLDACNQGRGKKEIDGVLRFLEDYVETHFSEEEKYMMQYGFPGYAGHKSQHLEFIEKFSEIKRKLDAEGPGLLVVVTTNQLLVDWLKTHIRKLDRELGAFLKEIGM